MKLGEEGDPMQKELAGDLALNVTLLVFEVGNSVLAVLRMVSPPPVGCGRVHNTWDLIRGLNPLGALHRKSAGPSLLPATRHHPLSPLAVYLCEPA